MLMAALQPAGRPLRANELPFEQIMTLAGLPTDRVSEMQCGGYGQWLAKQVPPPAGSPSRAEADRLAAEVAKRIARDSGVPPASTRAFVNEYDRELSFRVARALDSGTALIAEKLGQCARLFAGVRAGATVAFDGLTPAGLPAAVDVGLAACHARYTVAAQAATGNEAERHNAQARRARTLALAGKTGEALRRAEAALAAAVTDETRLAAIDGQESMMKLIICQPILAERQQR